MDIELMREFIVFSRYLNFSKAARHLNLAQPTLSSHVAAMERELGFDLVQRGKRIRLTPAGKRFCADSERIVGEFSETLSACRSLAKQKAGSITFERPLRQGGIDHELDHLLLLFQKEHPAIAVRKQSSSDMSMRDILESGAADLAFVLNSAIEVYDRDLAAQIETLPVPDRKRGPYYLWFDESHPLAERDSVSVNDIGGCRFIIPSSIRYQSLENLAKIGAGVTGLPISCSYWPGTYEECIINIRPDETMIVNETDLLGPAYSMVPGRKYVLFEGIEDYIQPAFVYLKENDNPALQAFADFISSLQL